ncbi:MAG: hypothetical protein II990_09370 [Muribaculaceae bacterium]|nr:hypothetical protein [Muribaculaceae bacterium]
MKKSLLLLVVAIFTLTTAFEASAKWTDRNTFNLKGPVKAIYDNYGDELWGFEKDGTLYSRGGVQIISNSRDKLGRITYIDASAITEFFSYTYNQKGLLIKESYTGGNRGWQSTTKYTYNAKGQVIKEVHIDEDGYRTTTTYTYQKFDSYGNWIKRTAKTGRKSTVETRTITYY